MSGTSTFSVAKLTNLFVAQWTLTLALPALLLAAGQFTIAITLPDELMFRIAIVLPFVAWLVIAFLQVRLLRHYLRRPWLWLATTSAGGILGNVAGGLAQLMFQAAIDGSIMNGDVVSAWADLVYPYTPTVFAALANAALLGLAQIACFDKTMGERVPWFCASIVAGILGAMFGALASHYSMQGMVTASFFDFISTPILFGLVPLLIAAVVNLTLYGLLTGICIKKLLTRRAELQRADLIGQFE